MNLPTFRFGSPSFCVYCGDIPDTDDHVIAVSNQTNYRQKGKVSYGPVAPACRKCNCNILNSRFFDSFYDRCEYVSRRLKKLALPVNWSDGDLQELSGTLKMFVENETHKRIWWTERSDWFQSRDWVLNLESLIYRPEFDTGNPCFHEGLFNYFNSTLNFLRISKPEWKSDSWND